MDQLFGISLNTIMIWLAFGVGAALGAILIAAWLNPIMVKLGLRNIPRRRAQTILIIIGITLSTVIISASLGMGDTLNYSIRSAGVQALGPIDHFIISDEISVEDGFGTQAYFPSKQYYHIREELESTGLIDGIAPGIGEVVPMTNPRTSLIENGARIVGVDPTTLTGFGEFRLTSGVVAKIEELGAFEAYINEEGAKELEAIPQDQIDIIYDSKKISFLLKGVVTKGGLAGDSSTIIIPLSQAQSILEKPDGINYIVISNLGDNITGAELSAEVAQKTRVLLSDRDVATQLKQLLNRPQVIDALHSIDIPDRPLKSPRISDLTTEIENDVLTDNFVYLLSDPDVVEEMLNALNKNGMTDIATESEILIDAMSKFSISEIKFDILEIADLASSFVTTFFLVLGLFSIMVGILLIFLIFVMLSAERRSEMGMARAMGARRIHLVYMFVFEGSAYALLSAAVGVALGLGVAALIIIMVNKSVEFDGEFRFVRHFEARSAIVSYLLGIAITLLTIVISAYRVSRLNIVSAVRGTPELSVRSRFDWKRDLSRPYARISSAIHRLWEPVNCARRAHISQSIKRLVVIPVETGRILVGIPMFMGVLFQVSFKLGLQISKQGWFISTMGGGLTWFGIHSLQVAPFRIGISLVIIGIGLMARTVLMRTSIRPGTRDRVVYSFIGITTLAFWVLPFGVIRSVIRSMVGGELDGGLEMFFVSGISMVAAAVWTVMYNSDLILKGLTTVMGRFGKIRPVLVTAVAYPMSSKFRTGLTLSMFSLVIFTLIVMSILTNVFDASELDRDEVTGGWDIEVTINPRTPVDDLEDALRNDQGIQLADVVAIGGLTTLPVKVNQTEVVLSQVEAGVEAMTEKTESKGWESYVTRFVDDNFIDSTQYKFKMTAVGFEGNSRQVWETLKNNPGFAVIDSSAVGRGGGFEDDSTFSLQGIRYEDTSMKPVDITLMEPRTGTMMELKVIAVLHQLSDNFGELGRGIITSKSVLDSAMPFPVPITTYRLQLSEGVSASDFAHELESALHENGGESKVIWESIEDEASTNRAFQNIFTGFMGLGLLVGVAALGVISLRAVVERRQQIGVLRAIGYRRNMIQLSFLIEASFIALLGTAIGIALGTVISYNIVSDVRSEEDFSTLRFAIPWLQISVIVGITYLFSIITTYLPALQASRIYPAEALRYE